MRETNIAFVAVTTVFCALLIGVSPVAAAEKPIPLSKEATHTLDNVQSRLDKKKESEKALKKKTDSMKSQIVGLQKDMVGLAKFIQKHEGELNELDRHLMQLKAKKALYKKSVIEDYKSISQLTMALERLSRTPTEMLLLQPSPPLDTARSAYVLKKTLPEIQARTQDYNKKLQEIEAIEDQIDEKIEFQTDTHQRLSEKRSNLKALLKKRQSVYEITLDEQKKQKEDVLLLTKQARNLKDLFARLQQKPSAPLAAEPAVAIPQKKAQMPAPPASKASFNARMPVVGNIVTKFGEKDALGASSEGLTFSARAGATVTAPMGGKVRFAGPFQNYKQILIIEHSGGYHSMIAGLGRIDTVVGAVLAEGEPVGTLDSAPQGAANLYYELRRNGKTINPQPALLAQGN